MGREAPSPSSLAPVALRALDQRGRRFLQLAAHDLIACERRRGQERRGGAAATEV